MPRLRGFSARVVPGKAIYLWAVMVVETWRTGAPAEFDVPFCLN